MTTSVCYLSSVADYLLLQRTPGTTDLVSRTDKRKNKAEEVFWSVIGRWEAVAGLRERESAGCSDVSPSFTPAQKAARAVSTISGVAVSRLTHFITIAENVRMDNWSRA